MAKLLLSTNNSLIVYDVFNKESCTIANMRCFISEDYSEKKNMGLKAIRSKNERFILEL